MGLSTTAGRTLVRDALVLRHRMPRLQARLDAGDLTVWRARRIAAAVIGHPERDGGADAGNPHSRHYLRDHHTTTDLT